MNHNLLVRYWVYGILPSLLLTSSSNLTGFPVFYLANLYHLRGPLTLFQDIDAALDQYMSTVMYLVRKNLVNTKTISWKKIFKKQLYSDQNLHYLEITSLYPTSFEKMRISRF